MACASQWTDRGRDDLAERQALNSWNARARQPQASQWPTGFPCRFREANSLWRPGGATARSNACSIRRAASPRSFSARWVKKARFKAGGGLGLNRGHSSAQSPVVEIKSQARNPCPPLESRHRWRAGNIGGACSKPLLRRAGRSAQGSIKCSACGLGPQRCNGMVAEPVAVPAAGGWMKWDFQTALGVFVPRWKTTTGLAVAARAIPNFLLMCGLKRPAGCSFGPDLLCCSPTVATFQDGRDLLTPQRPNRQNRLSPGAWCGC